jgi:hypothetical protein
LRPSETGSVPSAATTTDRFYSKVGMAPGYVIALGRWWVWPLQLGEQLTQMTQKSGRPAVCGNEGFRGFAVPGF